MRSCWRARRRILKPKRRRIRASACVCAHVHVKMDVKNRLKSAKFSSRGSAPHPARATALDLLISPCHIRLLRSWEHDSVLEGRERFSRA